MRAEEKRIVLYIVLLATLILFLVSYTGPVLDEPGAPPKTEVTP